MPRRLNGVKNTNTIKKQFNLSCDNASYLKEIKEQHHLNYEVEALELILAEHKKFELANEIATSVVKRIEEQYSNLFTRLRLGVRTADLNSQILVEMVNCICNLEILKETPYIQSDILPSPIFDKSTLCVKTKIANYKQRADSKKTKKKVVKNEV